MRLSVVDKNMQPLCKLQEHFMSVLRMLLEKHVQLRALRNARRSMRARACVRRDLPPTVVARQSG